MKIEDISLVVGVKHERSVFNVINILVRIFLIQACRVNYKRLEFGYFAREYLKLKCSKHN